jgi:predicted DNA-binding protein with PD1-like motif
MVRSEMRIKREDDILFVVIDRGEGFVGSMKEVLNSSVMENVGVVITALGMVKNAQIGYGVYKDNKVEYQKAIFEEPLELLGLSGFIIKDEKLPLHFHVYLGDPNGNVVGGHLFDFEVFTFVEMALLTSSYPLKRVLKNGLFLINF